MSCVWYDLSRTAGGVEECGEWRGRRVALGVALKATVKGSGCTAGDKQRRFKEMLCKRARCITIDPG